ncbi:MAG: hypothetical protein R3B45_17230 [Bdellovibrionota bacterium]
MRARRRGTSSTVYIWVHEQRRDESNAAIIGFAPLNKNYCEESIKKSRLEDLFRFMFLI